MKRKIRLKKKKASQFLRYAIFILTGIKRRREKKKFRRSKKERYRVEEKMTEKKKP